MYFKHIIGHQKQLNILGKDLETDNLAHAYLLAGPADLGKFTIAKALAKTIQTWELDEEKAFQVSNMIDKGIHSDTLIHSTNAEDPSIKISHIRSILGNLQMTGDSEKRILVMEDIDRMTDEAANAMLKMLEEPPSKVLFIFTSSNPKAILETILSRVRIVDFAVLEQDQLERGLANRFRLLDGNQIKKVADLSMGRVAKSIKLLENGEMLEAYENVYNQIRGFLQNHDVASAFGFISQIHSDVLLTKIFLEIAFVVLRENLKQGLVSGQNETTTKDIMRLESLFDVQKLSETNVNNRLLLENFILSL